MMANESATPRAALAAAMLASRPTVASQVLDGADPAGVALFFADQPEAAVAAALDSMRSEAAAEILGRLGARSAPAIRHMALGRLVAALRWLSPEGREEIVAAVGGELGTEIRNALSYPDNTAASLMDPRVQVARPSEPVGLVRTRLAAVTSPLYQVYVVDDQHRPVGAVLLQHLAAAADDELVGQLHTVTIESVDAFTHRDEVAELLASTATPAISVTDSEGQLIGVLRYRTLLGIAEADAATMMQTMVGASREEKALSPVSLAVRNRLPWLNINLVTAFIAAAVVGVFETTIARVTSLAVLLPVVAGQSGNTGSQALAITMRGLALREIRPRQWARVAGKELMVGLINGVAIALVTAAGVFVWSRSLPIAGVIAVAMVVSMAIAGLAGASVPIILRRLNQDPAQSSSIILTTVTDVVGFSSFLGLATLLIDQLVP